LRQAAAQSRPTVNQAREWRGAVNGKSQTAGDTANFGSGEKISKNCRNGQSNDRKVVTIDYKFVAIPRHVLQHNLTAALIMKVSPIWFLAGFVLCAVVLSLGLARTAEPSLSPTSALRVTARLAGGTPVKIVCFGDSITGVYYHTGSRRSWCELLGTALGRVYPRSRIQMINAGVSGNTTEAALKRMEVDVLVHRPDLVVVMFGMNDVRSLAPSAFAANLETIVRTIRDRGSEVVLMTPNAVGDDDPERPPAKVAMYAQSVREVALREKIRLVDAYAVFSEIRSRGSAASQRVMSDTIHPNFLGHLLFAEHVAREISGADVSLSNVPPMKPGLPSVVARLRSGEPVRVVAMPPYDKMIVSALKRWAPDATVDVIPWIPDTKSLAAIESQAKQMGRFQHRRTTDSPAPDLVLLAVPPDAEATTDEQFLRAYSWIVKWSLPFGRGTPEWDCAIVLPSVDRQNRAPGQQRSAQLAQEVARAHDVPSLERKRGDQREGLALFSEWIGGLLEPVGTLQPTAD